MDKATKDLFKQLGESKRVIVVLIKWRYPFYTNLETLKKPQDAALIGYFARQIQMKLTEDRLSHFDKVLWFDTDYGDFTRVYVNSDETKVPQVDEFVKELVTVVSPKKLRLLETEEFMIYPVAALREEHGIPGPINADLAHLRDKQLLKEHAEAKNVPSAKFIVVDFEQNSDRDKLIKDIEAKIGKYPMFAKPIHGVGSGGGGRIDSRSQLEEWISARTKDRQTYLVEELMEGREFWATLTLLPSGERRFLYLIYPPTEDLQQILLTTGKPIGLIGVNAKTAEKNFPGIGKFLERVTDAFDPPYPHMFSVQGFHIQCGKDDYKLTELAYRINGARGTGLSYRACGVSSEGALLMCHLDPDYQAEPEPNYNSNGPHISIWYPKIEGVLKEHTSLPDMKSSSKIYWFVQPGEKMKTATSLADFICSIDIAHEDNDILMKDLDFLQSRWMPLVA